MRLNASVVLATTMVVVGLAVAQDDPKNAEKKASSGPNEALSKLAGSRWTGTGELWLDKLGNEARKSECSLTVDAAAVGSFSYTWSYEGKAQTGSVVLRDGGAVWSDTWHQPTPRKCSVLADAWGLLALHYTYSIKGGPKWGWRIGLGERPTGELVMQMTNITPWGEEKRAVRMVFTRTP